MLNWFLTVPVLAPGLRFCTKLTSCEMLTIQLLGWDELFIEMGLRNAQRIRPATRIPAHTHQTHHLVRV